ncbi:2-oxo-4-hydroxy-4-carboxy-5-ureidoimidazoline decarboxylase [Evansella sp. AB-rgal1]|uniref:2-oxo-4-hydroxy-4-carboxy-5-ureidoimidazoline decarboxylase n=1 Tax=Evansella sp. AB-rgal1 TaxID=3242696 RepID=UPI00359EEB1E
MVFSMIEINKMTKAEFITIVGAVFEHSPWVAEKAWDSHPFSSFEKMYEVLVKEMNNGDHALKLSLLRAHPDLGSKLEMSETSKLEQKNAGLSELSEQEFREFSSLNKSYVEKFGFPYIMAVKGKTKETIKTNLKERINNSYMEEFEAALDQVSKIARFRLEDLVDIQRESYQ